MRKLIESWKGSYQRYSDVVSASSMLELQEYLRDGYKIVGNFHSYNKQSLHSKCVQLFGDFKYVKELSEGVYSVGGGSTVMDVMKRLQKDGRALINYGNNFTQNFVGAALGGTHGFGKSPTVADCILEFKNADGLSHTDISQATNVVEVTIKTIPAAKYEVTNCICPLSIVLMGSFLEKPERAYAVLPYSDTEDPICIVADYMQIEADKTPVPYEFAPASWWRVRLLNTIWKLDKRIPSLRRIAQRSLNFAEMKTWKVTTDISDLDPKYDQNMGVSSDTLNIGLWAAKPTHVSHNMALAAKPEETEELIKFAIKTANEIKYGFLTSFIGVRELKDSSDIPWAMNFGGPKSAIDFYCLPKHTKYMEALQHAISDKYQVNLHKAKSI